MDMDVMMCYGYPQVSQRDRWFSGISEVDRWSLRVSRWANKLASQICDKLHMSVPEFLLGVNQPESYGKWLGNKPVTITLSLRTWELSGFQVLHTCPYWHPNQHLGFPSKKIGPLFIGFSWTMALLEADLIEENPIWLLWQTDFFLFQSSRRVFQVRRIVNLCYRLLAAQTKTTTQIWLNNFDKTC